VRKDRSRRGARNKQQEWGNILNKQRERVGLEKNIKI